MFLCNPLIVTMYKNLQWKATKVYLTLKFPLLLSYLDVILIKNLINSRSFGMNFNYIRSLIKKLPTFIHLFTMNVCPKVFSATNLIIYIILLFILNGCCLISVAISHQFSLSFFLSILIFVNIYWYTISKLFSFYRPLTLISLGIFYWR